MEKDYYSPQWLPLSLKPTQAMEERVALLRPTFICLLLGGQIAQTSFHPSKTLKATDQTEGRA